MRVDKPIGYLLLMWPAVWAFLVSSEGSPNIFYLIIFSIGIPNFFDKDSIILKFA